MTTTDLKTPPGQAQRVPPPLADPIAMNAAGQRDPITADHRGVEVGTRLTGDIGSLAPELKAVAPGSVVVGHDGSAGAQHALGAAFVLADQLGAPLVVVRAWSITTAPRPAGWTFGYVSSSDEVQAAVLAELVSATEACRRRILDVEVSYLVPQGDPSERLIELSREARMLVVGSRGLGGFAELVLGSVSDQCVRYARCPVLVVKNPETD